MVDVVSRLLQGLRRVELGAQNALEIMRVGRLGPEYAAPFKVCHEGRIYRLRRYGDDHYRPSFGPPILLVPPLMIHCEVYDIEPGISPAAAFIAAGMDCWVIDFGSPEELEGGMERTLDDHILAISEAVDHVRDLCGHDVHLAGYSQGGMFVYQVAAYRRSAGLASLITFGSPVNFHRNIPKVEEHTAGKIIQALVGAAEKPLAAVEGLPGFLTSAGFKMLAPMKEVQQIADFMLKLHDRQALEKRESKRRFLGGEGFVAYPGPALRDLIEAVVIENRMALGGFVVAGRAVTLADIDCPILYVLGITDAIARAPSVRSVVDAAPDAEAYELSIHGGHFGIVVGSEAMKNTWPTVVDWMRWRAGEGERPANIRNPREDAAHLESADDAGLFDDVGYDGRLFAEAAKAAVSEAWQRLGDFSREVSESADSMRYQVTRLAQLDRIEPETPIGLGRSLAEQARRQPERTFFVWRGRALSYAEADRRVDRVVCGLHAMGIKPGERVGVLMETRPSYLSLVAALNRMGAVSVLLSPEGKRIGLDRALALGEVDVLVCDPERVVRGREAFAGRVFVLGGGNSRPAFPDGVTDMELIDPEEVTLPEDYRPNAGLARDLAMIIFTAGRAETPRAARITNRRWAVSAYGAAASCTLRPEDAVYCCLPLHHAAGILVAVGGALVGGSRLALSGRFDPDVFWTEVRRYGATVVFYAGDMARALVDAPPSATDRQNPVRLFAGSGLRRDVWRRLVARFGPVGVLEFYASTEGNAVLANASGAKVGALGRPLPGSTDMVLARYDFAARELVRDERERLVRCGVEEPGVLVARVDETHPLSSFDGYLEEAETRRRVVRGAFKEGDAYFVSGDLLRRDEDGDYWFVERVSDVIVDDAGPIFTRRVEDALLALPAIRDAVVYGLAEGSETEGALLPAAAIVLQPGQSLTPEALEYRLEAGLPERQWPRLVHVVDSLPRTDGYRPLKEHLKAAGIPQGAGVFRRAEDARNFQEARPHRRPSARRSRIPKD